jgi:hypothetical protein
MLSRISTLIALLGCLAFGARGGSDRATAPVSTAAPERQQALRVLDSWQKPILDTLAQLKRRKAADLKGDRAAVDRITLDVDRALAPVLDFSHDGRLAAATLSAARVARASRTSGDRWTVWADAVKRVRPVAQITSTERRQASQVADLSLEAVQAYGASYRAAGSEPPPAFRLG